MRYWGCLKCGASVQFCKQCARYRRVKFGECSINALANNVEGLFNPACGWLLGLNKNVMTKSDMQNHASAWRTHQLPLFLEAKHDDKIEMAVFEAVRGESVEP